MLLMSYTALIEESEEDNKIVETFCWVVLKTGTLTHPHVGLQAPQTCPEPSSSNPPGLLACHRAHSDLLSACCQQDGSENRTLAGGKMHTTISLCKGCFFREQQTARRNPWRTEQNRYDKGKIWGGKSETTVSFFNLPFMAYPGKAKSLSRTHSQPLSLSFTVKFVASFGVWKQMIIFFFF